MSRNVIVARPSTRCCEYNRTITVEIIVVINIMISSALDLACLFSGEKVVIMFI